MSNETGRPQEGDVVIESKGTGSITVIPSTPGPTKKASDSIEEIVSSARELASKIPDSISKAIERALSAREHVVMVRVNDEALQKLDHLVQAGIFKSRSESAAFLISEGIKAQEPLFERIKLKIAEIERLRAELRNIVSEEI